MSKDLGRVKKFNNKIKSYKERKEFINNLYSDNLEVSKVAMNNEMVAKTLEDQATYLLNSCDIESGRKQEYGYYRDEKDYRSNYAVGGNSISTDIESREDLHESVEFDSELNITNEYPSSLFCLQEMTSDEKKRLIKHGLVEKNNQDNNLSGMMREILEYILDLLSDDIDKKIVLMISDGMTESEIAEKLSIARQNVNKRINRICQKKI